VWAATRSALSFGGRLRIFPSDAELVSLRLSEQAPPVFLLDANRGGFPAEPGWFDNRSFVTSSDFPSVDYLRRYGISRVILVQPTSKPNADLLHVVVHMQGLGMTIALQAPWAPWAPRPHVFKPSMFPRLRLGMAPPEIRLPSPRL
jgi:hypothetical protein